MYIFVCNTGSDPSTPRQSDSNCPGDIGDDIREVGDLGPVVTATMMAVLELWVLRVHSSVLRKN